MEATKSATVPQDSEAKKDAKKESVKTDPTDGVIKKYAQIAEFEKFAKTKLKDKENLKGEALAALCKKMGIAAEGYRGELLARLNYLSAKVFGDKATVAFDRYIPNGTICPACGYPASVNGTDTQSLDGGRSLKLRHMKCLSAACKCKQFTLREIIVPARAAAAGKK